VTKNGLEMVLYLGIVSVDCDIVELHELGATEACPSSALRSERVRERERTEDIDEDAVRHRANDEQTVGAHS